MICIAGNSLVADPASDVAQALRARRSSAGDVRGPAPTRHRSRPRARPPSANSASIKSGGEQLIARVARDRAPISSSCGEFRDGVIPHRRAHPFHCVHGAKHHAHRLGRVASGFERSSARLIAASCSRLSVRKSSAYRDGSSFSRAPAGLPPAHGSAGMA